MDRRFRPPLPSAAMAAAILMPLTAAPGAEAQEKPLEAGQTVRVTVSGEPEPVVGELTLLTPEAWHLLLDDGAVRRLDPDRIEGAEVGISRRNFGSGAIIGGLAGMLVMGLVYRAEDPDDCDPGSFCITPASEGAELGSALAFGAVGGAGLGALVGGFSWTTRWEPAAMPAVSGGAGGAGVQLRWTVPLSWRRGPG